MRPQGLLVSDGWQMIVMEEWTDEITAWQITCPCTRQQDIGWWKDLQVPTHVPAAGLWESCASCKFADAEILEETWRTTTDVVCGWICVHMAPLDCVSGEIAVIGGNNARARSAGGHTPKHAL